MTSPLTDFTDGVAGLLVAHGIGSYNAAGVYTSGQVGITTASVPTTPDQIICLTPSPIEDELVLNNTLVDLQIKLRGTLDPRVLMDRSSAIFNVLEGLQNVDFGAMHVALIWRQSSGFMGQDDNQRWMWSDHYYCRTNWATPNRPD